MRERISVRCSGAAGQGRSHRTVSAKDAESLVHQVREKPAMGRPTKKERTPEQTTDLRRAIDEARELIYGACFKLIRAQDIVVDEEDTLYRLQVAVQVLRNYADQELTQIK